MVWAQGNGGLGGSGLWDSEVLWVGAVSSRGGGDLGVGSKGWST